MLMFFMLLVAAPAAVHGRHTQSQQHKTTHPRLLRTNVGGGLLSGEDEDEEQLDLQLEEAHDNGLAATLVPPSPEMSLADTLLKASLPGRGGPSARDAASKHLALLGATAPRVVAIGGGSPKGVHFNKGTKTHDGPGLTTLHTYDTTSGSNAQSRKVHKEGESAHAAHTAELERKAEVVRELVQNLDKGRSKLAQLRVQIRMQAGDTAFAAVAAACAATAAKAVATAKTQALTAELEGKAEVVRELVRNLDKGRDKLAQLRLQIQMQAGDTAFAAVAAAVVATAAKAVAAARTQALTLLDFEARKTNVPRP